MMVTGDLERIDTLDPRHLDDLLELFRHEWWTKDRQLDEVRLLLEEADVVVAYRDTGTGRLVGFARVRRRDASRALVLDVIVGREHRERGVGGDLLDAIVGHRALRSVRQFELNCRPDVVAFYARRGFVEEVRIGRVCFLRLSRDPG